MYQYKYFHFPGVSQEDPESTPDDLICLPQAAACVLLAHLVRKTSISALLTMPKTLTVWITINCGKF